MAQSKKYLLKNIGKALLWFLQMLGFLAIAIVIAGLIPQYENIVYGGTFVLFLFLRARMVQKMRIRIQEQQNKNQET